MKGKISPTEFDFSFSRSSGAGGQNVNKVNSKVTLSWNFEKTTSISKAMKLRFTLKYPSVVNDNGILKITSQRYREQSRNIVDVTDKLYEMLETVKKPKARRVATKPTKGSRDRRLKNKKGKSEIKKNRKKVNI